MKERAPRATTEEAENAPGETADATSTSPSPSLDFLHDLAHVSDRTPDVLGQRLTTDGTGPAPLLPARFELRGRLGAGGFGVVYEVLDRERNAAVALKVLRRRDGRAVSRFKHEFRSLCEVAHENLVQLYELHAEGDAWFFTMELVRGESALSHVRGGERGEGRFDEARLRATLRQLAGGLSFLHRSGKLHRDVKPSNVMVSAEGRVVLLDFGLVTDIALLPEGEGVLGTPAYMAPEQAAGMPAGTAADWYAVGVMLYEALTGRLPFDPRVPRAAAPPPPRDLAPGVPEDLERLALDLLARAPERRPDGREVRDRLSPRRSPRGTRGEPARQDAPFVGRADELDALRGALGAAEAGSTVAVLVQGRSGMGKSALLGRFLDDVRGRGPACLALSGRCFEQESVPYKAVDGLVDDLAARLRAREPAELSSVLPADFAVLARLFPQLRELARDDRAAAGVEGEAPAQRQRAFAALRALLAHAAPCPVLVVDDLQWGDLDSIALLADLLHAGGPLLLVAAYRAEDAETSPVVVALATATAGMDVRRVEVAGLDDLDAETLSRALLAADGRSGDVLAETAVRAIVSEARGSPFLLSELSRHRPGARRGADTAGTRSDTTSAPPADIGALLAARIARLPEPARRLLEVVAVAGAPVARAVAASAAYGSEPGAHDLAALGLLRAGRLVRSRRARVQRGPVGSAEDVEELLAYHDRIRETVVAALPADVERARHLRLADALEAAGGAEPERLLFHFRRGGRTADAARLAEAAAAQAYEALAFDRAARLYREAIDLGAPSGGPALRVRLGDALTGAGRPRDAGLAYLAAAEGAAPAEALRLRRRAVEHLLMGGYLDEGQAILRDVLREAGVPPPSSPARSLLSFAALQVRLAARGQGFRERSESSVGERALVRIDACHTAALGLGIVNPVLAGEAQARHLLLALDAGEPYRVARALCIEVVFATLRRGKPHPSADRMLAVVRAVVERLDHPHLAALYRLCSGMASMVSGAFRHALDLLSESESILRARCTGVHAEIDMARLHRATCLWMSGGVDELTRLVPAVIDDARERGNLHAATVMQTFAAPLCALAADQPARAHEALGDALARWPRRAGSLLHFREALARARVALYEGQPRAARAAIEGAWPALLRTGLLLSPAIRGELGFVHGLAALGTGDTGRAARDARALARIPILWTENGALVIRAGLLRREGDFRAAVGLLAQAEQRGRGHGALLNAHAIQRRRGEWLGGSEGASLVDAADAWMKARGIVQPERLTAMLIGVPG